MKKNKSLELSDKKEIAINIVKMFRDLKINPIDSYEIICMIKMSMEDILK